MTARKRKIVTDPGPFGTKRAPIHEQLPSSELDTEVDDLYRFREIPVSAEMREEFLQAKLPLAKPDQLIDTQPPSHGLNGGSARVPVDRNAPTEPALSRADQIPESDASEDSYSRSAPTLLNVRRRRARYRRMVALGVALAFGLLVWAVARPGSPPPATPSPATQPPATQPPGSPTAGSPTAGSPTAASPAPARIRVTTEAAAPAHRRAVETAAEPETKSTDLEIEAQPSKPAPDPTSEPEASKKPPSVRPAGAAPRPAKSPVAPAPAPTQQTDPSTKREPPAKKKSFDPEELIF